MLKYCLVALALVAMATALPIAQEGKGGVKWALIIAGSNTWGNYRHQADAYHAYQLVKDGGIKEENIVLFHYDDIANSAENPKKGTVINNPQGQDVYHGVPKANAYTGSDVTAANFLAALLGDKKAANGKPVIDSGPNDTVFVYYADHGGPGILGMPNGQTYLYGKDIVSTLQKKHAAKGYKELVFYLEACESGSIFDGVLPENINVFATTAANPSESSWGCYCPGQTPAPPTGYNTCLGDLYSVAWLEDTDMVSHRDSETLEQQYNIVKMRTSQNGTYSQGSHVMQYGELTMDSEKLDAYIGAAKTDGLRAPIFEGVIGAVNNRDAELLYLEAKHPQRLTEELARRESIDSNFKALAEKLATDVEATMTKVATPVVEDWDCLKASWFSYHETCGHPKDYGMKHGKVLANLCNAGVSAKQVEEALKTIC